MDLLDELKKLTQRLQEENIDYALCGGLALAVYALPRATLDIDLLIEPTLLERTSRLVHDLGYTIEAQPMIFHDGAIEIHRFIKLESDAEDGLIVDLLLVSPAIQEAWNQRVQVPWDYGKLSVVAPEGLILLKSLRGSGQDMDDISLLRSIASAY